MKVLLRLYHFLGSIHFAITLITLTAAFVVAGTFLEAHSESHLFSVSFTYHNPVFLALIWGFFVNILISALRRWPFETKHIPFLTTHLGLLMLLGGVIIKSYYGTQGSMSMIEGGSSNRIFLPNTYAIHVEKKDPANPGKKIQMDFPFDKVVKQRVRFDDVEIRIADYAQHSQERKQSWIKGDHAIIVGMKPIPVVNFQHQPSIMNKARFHHENSTPWNIQAFSTHQVGEAAKQVYLEGLTLQISDTITGEIISKRPMEEALANSLNTGKYRITFNLDWNFDSLNGLENPTLFASINGEKMAIALTGPDSLINRNVSSPYRGKLPFTIDISREPILLFIQDEQEDDYLFFFNPYGEIHSTIFRNDNLPSLVVYDDGFGGYAAHTPFPFHDFPSSRQDKEQAELLRVAVQLRQSLQQNSELSPPLQLLKDSVNEKGDFVQVTLHFLQAWDASNQLLFNSSYLGKLHPIIQNIDWNKVPQQQQYACGWFCVLLEEMETQLQEGKSFVQVLVERGWPFAQQFAALDAADTDQMITLFAQQLFAAADQLPRPQVMPAMNPEKALSAYLRAFGITLNNIRQPLDSHHTIRTYHAARLYNDRVRKILSPVDQIPAKTLVHLINAMAKDSRLLAEIKQAYIAFQKDNRKTKINDSPSSHEMGKALVHFAPLDDKLLSAGEVEVLSASLNAKDVILESPLTLNQTKIPALQKWEDNHPLITLEIRKGRRKEYFTLTYDKYGTGLAWPILDGEYTLRYQPLFMEIPYKVRLHDARQINYPGTQQPYSYESDIILTDLRNLSKVEKTISMNNVHETKEGYRFYLASLSPPSEVTPQRVQIVVNHDPAKYLLTYPGAIIMSFGIVLLFWMRPYKKQS